VRQGVARGRSDRRGINSFLQIWAASLLLLASWTFCESATPTVCASSVPRSVEALVSKEFSSWKITDLADLIPDDRVIWERARPRECPGFVTGRFIDAGKDSHAALLLHRKGREVRQKLIVLEPTLATYKIRTLWELAWDRDAPPGRVLVISRIGPGTHWNAYRTVSVVTKLDSVALEAIEAGVTMFYWEGGTFLSLDISV
jgi:hypothetical protein